MENCPGSLLPLLSSLFLLAWHAQAGVLTDVNWVGIGNAPGLNGPVFTAVVDNVGDQYAGGSFTMADGVSANNVAKWNGSTWSALGSGMNGSVSALAIDGAGNLYAGGAFTTAGGVSAISVAKWDGTTWSAMGTGMNGGISALATDGSGNLYAGGSFTTAGGVRANYIAKWDGISWSALGSGMSDGVSALAVDGSGNLYAGGSFTAAGGASTNYVAKWDGSAWSALGSGVNLSYPDVNPSVSSLAVDGLGNLYAGVSYLVQVGIGGGSYHYVTEWNGSAWSTLGSGMNGQVTALTVDRFGRLNAAGSFTTAGGVSANSVAKWDGSAWSPLGTGLDTVNGNGAATALTVDGLGNIYGWGYFVTVGGVSAKYVSKWNGTVWSALGTLGQNGLDGSVSALVVGGSGNMYVGGYFTTAGAVVANSVAKWDGSAWSALSTGLHTANGNGSASALAVDGSGNLFAGGFYYFAGATQASNIAKWNGTAWGALGVGTSTVSALAVAASGNVYSADTFGSVSKWDGNGWLVLGSGMSSSASALAVDGTGNVYAGGMFTTAGGASANYMAKWNGSAWLALGTGMDSGVDALAVDGLGNLYAGGGYNFAGGILANNIAKWNGTKWSALGSGMNGTVRALVWDGAGNLYAGGDFTIAGGVQAHYIAKWDGSAWSALGSGMNGPVRSLSWDPVGRLYAGGDFTRAGGKSSAHFAYAATVFPVIAVQQPAGSGLVSGGNPVNFGSVSMGASTSKTFTIQNTGTANLTLGALSLSGTNAADFSLTSSPVSPVMPVGSTTFTVQFAPTSLGAETAVLQIASNVGDGSPFSVTLSGTGGAPAPPLAKTLAATVLSFDGATLNGQVNANSTSSAVFFDYGPTMSYGTTVVGTPTPVIGTTATAVSAALTGLSPNTTYHYRVRGTSSAGTTNGMDLMFTLGLPQIAVEEPVGTGLTNGNASVNFGNAGIATGIVAKSFTIRNPGYGNLTGLAITKDGTDQAMFTVTASAVAPVLHGGSTTFTVQFAPTSLGAKTAVIHITSNDSANSPFNVTLIGTGAAAVPPVVMTSSATALTFGGSTLNGTVNSRGFASTVTFDYGTTTAYGGSVTAVQSPLTSTTAALVNAPLAGLLPHTVYNFRVRSTGTQGSAVGANVAFTTLNHAPTSTSDTALALPSAKVTIHVLANDSDADGDALSIYSFIQPGAAVGTVARVGTDLVFTPAASFSGGFFTYIAADAFGGRNPATVVNLNPGTCICASSLTVASDQATAVFPVTASAPFAVAESLSWLSFNPILPGDTQVTFVFSPNPSLSSRMGTIVVGGNPVTITQSGVAAAPVLTVPSTIPNAAISASYDLAIPTQNGPVTYIASGLPPGLTLSNLSGHITGMPIVANTYHASVSAKNAKGSAIAPILFDITVLPFPASLVGGWSATMDRNATVNAGLGGLLSFTVSANGPVTGTLKNGAASYAFTGRLNTAPDPANPAPLNARLTVAIPHTSLVLVMNMNSPSVGYTTGTVSHGASVANLSGAQQVWSLVGHPAAANYSGRFTTALQPTSTDASIPQGDGFLTFTVSTTGLISWSGQLADGTVLATGSSTLWPGGEIPLYASLYAGKGSLLGAPVITAVTRVLAGNLSWSKNAQPATVRAYGAGFGALNPAILALLGGGYTPPAVGFAVLTNVIPPTGSAQITFVDGGIGSVGMAASLAQTLTISSANVATTPTIFGGNYANIKIIAINPAKGTFTGSLTLKDANRFNAALPQVSRAVSFNGVFLQGGNNQGTGYFLLPGIAGPPANVTTSPMTSGQVLITPAM